MAYCHTGTGIHIYYIHVAYPHTDIGVHTYTTCIWHTITQAQAYTQYIHVAYPHTGRGIHIHTTYMWHTVTQTQAYTHITYMWLTLTQIEAYTLKKKPKAIKTSSHLISWDEPLFTSPPLSHLLHPFGVRRTEFSGFRSSSALNYKESSFALEGMRQNIVVKSILLVI